MVEKRPLSGFTGIRVRGHASDGGEEAPVSIEALESRVHGVGANLS